MRAVWVGVAGFFGAVARYWLSTLISRAARGAFPLGTFVINISGCFLIGFLSALLTNRLLPHPAVRTAVLTGFIGAYTTFSTFSYETVQLVRGGAVGLALVNVGASLVLGLGAAWLGLQLGGAL